MLQKRELPTAGGALSKALKLLSISDRFEAEIRKKLEGFPQEEVEATIEHLLRKNLINDRRAAEGLARSRSGRKGVGSVKLQFELRRRGASDELISEVCQSEDDSENAKTVLQAKFPLRDPGEVDRKVQEKAFRFLMSRGFGYETAHNVIRDYFAVDV